MENNNFNSMLKEKIISIEILRFISSFLIVIWHFQNFFLPFFFRTEIHISEIKKIFNPLYSYDLGSLAVKIFFCISGIVFAKVYLMKKTSFKDFFIKRFSRLYPLHFLTLFLVVILQFCHQNIFGRYAIYFNNDLYHLYLNIFFLNGWGYEKGFSFNGPSWSISVEIILYFLFYLLMNYFKKSNKILVLIIFILIFFHYTDIFNSRITFYGIFFFAGVLIYKIYITKKIILLNIFCLLSLSLNFLDIGFHKIIFPIFLIVISLNFEHKIKKNNIFIMLGNLTYSSYLIHVPLQLAILIIFNKIGLGILYNNLIFFIFGYIVITYLSAYVIYYHYELPLNKKLNQYFISK